MGVSDGLESVKVIEEQNLSPIHTVLLRLLKVEVLNVILLNVVPKFFGERVVVNASKQFTSKRLISVLVLVLLHLVDNLDDSRNGYGRASEVQLRHRILVRVSEYQLVAFLERIADQLGVLVLTELVLPTEAFNNDAFPGDFQFGLAYEFGNLVSVRISEEKYFRAMDSVIFRKSCYVNRMHPFASRFVEDVEEPEFVIEFVRILDGMRNQPFTE